MMGKRQGQGTWAQTPTSRQWAELGKSPSFLSQLSTITVYRALQHLSPALLLIFPLA